MKNYCYLSIDNHQSISDKVYNHLINNYNVNEFGFWTDIDHTMLCEDVPELQTALGNIGLSINVASIIKTSGVCPIHVDYPSDSDVAQPRILWPVKNCEGSRTNFFHIERSWLKEKKLSNGIPYYHIDNKEPLVEIDSFELNQPAIINPDQAHNVSCNPVLKGDRISLTIDVSPISIISKELYGH